MGKKDTTYLSQSSLIYGAVLCLILAIFIGLRFLPISNATVPYTYDQGRDFMAARNIVVNKDITLIGPTTGAEGVFHGVWWYYFLSIPFVLFGGSALGFYYFIALCAVVQGVIMAWLIKKEFTPLLSLLFLGIVAISPYFIKTSVFAINSILVLPFILILASSAYMYFKSKKPVYLYVLALSAGMIAEAEVAFGIFLFPSLVLAVILARQTQLFFGSFKRILIIMGGVCSAMIFRILFELKYNFLQTRALISFWGKEGTQPKGILDTLTERLLLFKHYYLEIYPEPIQVLGLLLLVIAFVGYIKGFKKLEIHQKKWIAFMGILTVMLFFVSLVYKNSFFWAYYFEGIHYLFILLVGVGLYCLGLVYKKPTDVLLSLVILLIFITGAMNLQKARQIKPENIGLRMHTEAVSYLYKNVGNEQFCLRMYTPPVITHTYNYLLDQQSRTGKGMYPRTEYLNNECWYFIESDSFAKRRDDWIINNIPEGASKEQEQSMSKDLVIQKWVLKETPTEQ